MTDAAAEMQKMKDLENRITAPSIWARVPCGVRIEDLQDHRYEEAVKLIKKHYLPDELTYRSLNFTEDKEAVDEFAFRLRYWLKDKMSLAAVKEGTDKLVGVLVIRIQEKSAFSRTFSHVKLTHNPLLTTVVEFIRKVEKPVNVFEQFNVRKYFKVYLIALKSRYRHRGIAKEMLKSAILMAKSASVPAIAGVFQTSRGHQICEELGFKKYHEIYYVRYQIDDEVVFWDTGLGNYGAALMAYRIPDVEEPPELQKQKSSRFHLEEDTENNTGEGDDD